MIPGSTQTFNRARWLSIAAITIVPIVILGIGWWILDAVVLSPSAPGPGAAAEQCVAFIAHPKGLARLDRGAREEFVDAQFRRLVEQPSFGPELAGALRRSTREEQEGFRNNLFDVFKPRILEDARRLHELPRDQRQAFLDAKLIDFKKSERLLRAVNISKGALGGAMVDEAGALRMIQSKITDEERALGIAYFKAMAERAQEILADPDLKAQFEKTLGFPLP